MKAADRRSVPPGYQLVPPDGGYGWVMVAASVGIGIFMSIPIIAIGLLLPDIIQATKTTAATASWIPSIAFSVGLIIAPFNIIFMEKYSHRTSSMIGGSFMTLGLTLSYFATSIELLFLTYGVLFGIGFGMLSNASTLILNLYFTKRYGQAIGYVMAAHALSRLVFAPIVELLVEKYDYQGVLLIMGGLTMNCVVLSLLFHPVTPHLKLKAIEQKPVPVNEEKQNNEEVEEVLLENGVEKTKSEEAAMEMKNNRKHSCWMWCTKGPLKALNFSQLKNPIFYMLFYSNLIFFILSVYVGVFLPSLLLEMGLTSMEAAIVQSARSGGEVVGRMFIPWAQVHFKIPLYGFYIIICAIQAAMLIAIVFLNNFAVASTIAVIIGMTSGGIIALIIMMMVECVGILNMGATFSLIMFLNGFISLGFGPFIGFLRDVLGTYSICFYVLASSLLINCVMWLLKPLVIRNKSQIPKNAHT